MRLFCLSCAAALFLATQIATPALAKGCPEEHRLTEPRDLGKISGKDVKVELREALELGGWRDMGPFRMRLRQFEIAPGGRVPVHSHGDRPSIIYFISGTATEHNAFCAEPIEHMAGTTVSEFGPGIMHWWSNDGDVPAVLISADVVPSKP